MSSRDKRKAEEAAAPRKGRVYVATDRGLFPIGKLRKFEMKKQETENRAQSKQLKQYQQFLADKDLVPLPFNVAGLLVLQDNCSYFDACVRQIAKDVVGQGWELNQAEGVEKGNEEMKKTITDFLLDPNADEDSLEDVLERLIIDWGVIGWFGLEVSRSGGDGSEPDALYQVPAHTLRVHRSGNKFCQIRENKYRWFRHFGYDEQVHEDTGTEGKGVPTEKQAHEMIFYRNYYAQSSWYGVSNILPAVGPVKGLIGIRDYNLAFFENYGVPAAIVIVEGDWEEEGIKQISDFIDVEIKGSNNAHKTIVLNPPEGGKVTWEPLVTEIKEGHFKLYHKNLRDEVLVSYRMPPYRIGIVEIGSLGGSTAAEATRIYIDSIVNPLKAVLNHIMTQKIIRDGFKCEDWNFELGMLDIRDVTSEVARFQVLFGMGVVTRAQVAEALGLDEIPDTDKYRDTYFISAAYREVGAEPAFAMMDRTDEEVANLNAALGKALKKKGDK